MGDNLTGEGDGDDETILIDLDKIHLSVFCVVFTVNVFLLPLENPFPTSRASSADWLMIRITKYVGTTPLTTDHTTLRSFAPCIAM